MPRNNREYLQRYAKQVLNHLNTIIIILDTIIEMYGDIHPEYTNFYIAMQDQCKLMYELLEQFIKEKM